jgi:acyl-CoA synthetase (AMP-forming)/AMP-acid ligase II
LSSGTGIRRLRAQVQPDRVAIDTEGADGLTYARWPRRATSAGHALRGGVRQGTRVGPAPPDFDGWTATVADLDTGGTGRLEAGVGPDDIADIPFTSGTTGPAKAFTNPHGNLVYGKARSTVRRSMIMMVCVSTSSSRAPGPGRGRRRRSRWCSPCSRRGSARRRRPAGRSRTRRRGSR